MVYSYPVIFDIYNVKGVKVTIPDLSLGNASSSTRNLNKITSESGVKFEALTGISVSELYAYCSHKYTFHLFISIEIHFKIIIIFN